MRGCHARLWGASTGSSCPSTWGLCAGFGNTHMPVVGQGKGMNHLSVCGKQATPQAQHRQLHQPVCSALPSLPPSMQVGLCAQRAAPQRLLHECRTAQGWGTVPARQHLRGRTGQFGGWRAPAHLAPGTHPPGRQPASCPAPASRWPPAHPARGGGAQQQRGVHAVCWEMP